MSEKLVQAAAFVTRTFFGMPPTHVEQIRRGVMTYKFAVELPQGERYVVRFYPPSRSKVVEYEPDLLRRCANRGIGTPEVVIDSRTGPPAEMPYVVYRLIQGTPLSDRLPFLSPESLERIVRQLVGRLRALEQIPVTGCGDLVSADHARFDSLREFLNRSFAEGLIAAERSRLWREEIIDDLRAISRAVDKWPEHKPVVLTWGDISTENILLRTEDEVAGLVDFEGVIAADRLLNLGYADAWYHGSAFFEALVRAWDRPLDENQWQRIHLYTIVRGLRLARFADVLLPTGLSRTPIEELLPGFYPAVRALAKELSQDSLKEQI